ncbi:bifunctional hydroxymethylpyrimidine kinase/phosphomethylpyrimidine kinase [Limosilactobacillus mucosae]|uniref:bifunctional hydroxymethylpyrimidine kinase/phosphomethylpyrimidine kinase n=1 Tax=Limosilactobacillus mucosae TaxID=97478 RepID=UPI0039968301
MIKPALLIEDFSALGQISMIGALSVLQAMGITTASLPATILSSQTEGFGQPVVLDTEQWIQSSLRHWQAQVIEPSGVLIGYLGQRDLAQQLSSWLEHQNLADCLKIVDPVMGDQGQLYPGFDQDYVEAIKKLCRYADLITPNWTELCLLAGLPYSLPTTETLNQGIDQLKAAGINAKIIVTGVHSNGQIGCCWRQNQQDRFDSSHQQTACPHQDWQKSNDGSLNFLNSSDARQNLQSEDDRYQVQPLEFCGNEIRPGHFYGTGDIFSALLYGRLLQGWPLEIAVKNATDAMEIAIQQTVFLPDNERRFGLRLDHLIHYVSKA